MATRTEPRVRTDPRISRRRKAVARSKRKKIAAIVLAIVVTAVAIWAAFWSPLLHVRRIQVVGAQHTAKNDVRAAANLDNDDNLLLVSTGRVAAAAEELPWVAAADVDRRLPGTVRIKVTERKPALVVTVASGTWTVDAAGRVLEEGATSARLPTLTGAALGALAPGERLVTEPTVAALEVWRSLPDRLQDKVASVVAPEPERIALVLRDGLLVRYGGADRLPAKNKVLAALLARLGSRGATYVDVSVPSNPAVGPAPTTTPSPTALPTG